MERRRFLKGAGVAIALPVMESLMPKARGAVNKKPIRRFVCLSNNYGVYQKAFFPEATQAGKNYDMPETLKPLEKHRKDFTTFSNLDASELWKYTVFKSRGSKTLGNAPFSNLAAPKP